MTTKKKNKRLDRKFKIALLFFLIIAIGISGFNAYMIIKGLNEYNKGTDAYDEIKDIAIDEQEKTGSRIDFVAMEQINPDIVGWLTMPDTVIDYPVVKGDDNDYYLHHLFNGEYNSLGTLFVDFRNKDPFEDQITVIYGHSMKNGSMFFLLEKYRDQSFYEEHKQLIYETKDKTYIFEPFAGEIVDAEIPFLQFNFSSKKEYMAYLDDFIAKSTFRSEISPSEEDKTVMMIKCSAAYTSARYVLLCRVREA